MVESGVYGDGKFERRLRIRNMMERITRDIDDDIFFIDSDVIIPGARGFYSSKPVSFCTKAICKDCKEGEDIIDWCQTTNIFLPRSYRPILLDALSRYRLEDAIDMYINHELHSAFISVPGTVHYINGKKYVTT
ncbi:MAG: hypothetical protein QW046_02920 [Candidatus Micrarchaeaceae archaeon]